MNLMSSLRSGQAPANRTLRRTLRATRRPTLMGWVGLALLCTAARCSTERKN